MNLTMEQNGNVAAMAEPRVTDVEQQIINQLEYYFGDVNLARDKFLIEEIKKDEGWVPMSTMLKFKRLAALSSDSDFIVDALLKSPNNLFEISEDKQKIRRSPLKPLPGDDYRKQMIDRTVYVKGFPADSKLDELISFFKQYGSPETVNMRFYSLASKSKKEEAAKFFKGSVFVTMPTVEEAQKIVALESLKYKDTELIKKMQKDYWRGKAEEREAKRRAKHSSDAKPGSVSKAPVTCNDEGFTKGLVLKLTSLPSTANRDNIKELFRKHGFVKFVEYDSRDDPTTANVRFVGSENAAKESLDKFKAAHDGKLMLNDQEFSAQILEGEAEEAFWKALNEKMKSSKSNNAQRGGGGGKRGGRHNRGGSRSHANGNYQRKGAAEASNKRTTFDEEGDEEPAAKVAKTDTVETVYQPVPNAEVS